MSKSTKETILAYVLVAIIFIVSIGIYIAAMKYLPCDFFLRIGDSPTRCIDQQLNKE